VIYNPEFIPAVESKSGRLD